MVWVIDNVVELAGRFAEVAFSDPLSFILVAMGAILVGAASAVMGVLSVGAALDALTPDVSPGPRR